MKKNIKKLINKITDYFGYKLIRSDDNSTDLLLWENKVLRNEMGLLIELKDYYLHDIIDNFYNSKSQLKQDLFVLSQLGFKKNGYFVEFGATNGVDLSNTYLLEKNFDWSGILAEPAKCWHEDLFINRKCFIETACVYSESNLVLDFNQVENAELSTIGKYSEIDFHKVKRKKLINYNVNTISLIDMLKKYDAPKNIDYLSIDTEGSEYEILKNFDFSEYSFKIITCEHNFTPMRDEIYRLLTKNGYDRVLSEISMFDDWYIKSPAVSK